MRSSERAWQVAVLGLWLAAVLHSSGCIFISIGPDGPDEVGPSSQPAPDAGADANSPADAAQDGGSVEAGVDGGSWDGGAYDSSGWDSGGLDSALDGGGFDGGSVDGDLDAGSPDLVGMDVPTERVEVVLDPASMQFGELPTGAQRSFVTGHDAQARVCATLVWMSEIPSCGIFGGEPYGPFYVYLETDTDGPCAGWGYGGNAQVLSADGCVDMAMYSRHGLDLVDMDVEVFDDNARYHIVADNRHGADPQPLSLGLRYNTDVPEEVYVQTSDDGGAPGWVQLWKDNRPLVMVDRCDVTFCDSLDCEGCCAAVGPMVHSLTHSTDSGQIWQSWDGYLREFDESRDCWVRTPAPAGTYTARFCFGWQMTSGVGPYVVDPTCFDEIFSLPATQVVGVANYGG
ncbi:MAG: hypothetical protein ABIJ09_06270 [Pseudomonadota bacterium]